MQPGDIVLVTSTARKDVSGRCGILKSRHEYVWGRSWWWVEFNIDGSVFSRALWEIQLTVVGRNVECDTIPAPKPETVMAVSDDWRFFTNRVPGECPCGRSRDGCEMHGTAK